MPRKSILHRSLAISLAILILILFATSAYIATLPDHTSGHETIVVGQDVLSPGSQSALRVLVRDSKDASPLKDAQVKISLKPADGGKVVELYNGVTEADGTADVAFNLPETAEAGASLTIETRSSLGSDWVSKPVTLERQARILLTTDKPIYQPGQVIHMRALALDGFSQRALGGEKLEFIVADGKGNKVFRQEVTNSDFGVASADFKLADEVNLGDYKISAGIGQTVSEKTVGVKRYTLPRFDISLNTEKTFYQPGQTVIGTLHAGYFYGKPVDEAAVRLTGYTFDVERADVFTQQGETDANGDFAFEFNMPDFLAGSDLEKGLGRFYLEATITDRADHRETSNLSLPVSNSALVIEVMPESGQLRPGVENILYVMTSYPDGAPADAQVSLQTPHWPTVGGESHYGVAELAVTPTSGDVVVQVDARTPAGETATQKFTFQAGYISEGVLLRPYKPTYRVGETMNLTILSAPQNSTVYLDIVRAGQTVSTRAVDVTGGKAVVAVDLTPDLYGTLELHAYRILRSGEFVRDTRLVVIDNAQDLQVDLSPTCPAERKVENGLCVFHPGEAVGLDIAVRDQNGSAVRSALGLSIVDESVFALAEQDPGFERLYFLLESELLTPKWEVHGYSLPALVREKPGEATPNRDPALLRAYNGAAFASLAAAAPQAGLFSLYANSHQDTLQRLQKQQRYAFTQFGNGLSVLLSAAALLTAVLAGIALWRRRRLWLSLGLTVLIWGGLFGTFFITESLDWYVIGMALLAFLPFVFFAMGIVALIGVIRMLIEAIQLKDEMLGWILALFMFYAFTFGLFFFVAIEGSMGDAIVVAALISLLLMILLLTALVIGIGLKFNLKTKGGPGTAIVSLLLLALLTTHCAAPQMAFNQAAGPAAPTANPVIGEQEQAPAEAAAPQAPRLRQYFPETLLWLPDAVTGEDGKLHVDLTAADSITTWRMTALASTQDGRLGSAGGGLRVFQDFFIEPDLPAALTVGDQVSIPVGVYNYLPQSQTVRLDLEQADWFKLLNEPTQQLNIAANDIAVAYFRIQAVDFGRRPFKVTAWGSQMSDAVQKFVQVYPDGAPSAVTRSGFLKPASGEPSTVGFAIPAAAIPGTQSLQVKVYPGILSQVVEGMESILRMPYGCFEQTSSTTYPNVMVLDYLKSTNQLSPEVQMKAEDYINLGYQRLTTFEVGSGGFSLFGDEPADRMLTAYGLQEFTDMGRVHAVDPDLIRRTAEWLLGQQRADGSWESDRGMYHETAWKSLPDKDLPTTAYITWSLIEAGYGDDPRTRLALAYLRDRSISTDVAYVTALAANALVAADMQQGEGLSSEAQALLDRLAETAVRDKDVVYWQSGVPTYMGGVENTGAIETTALVALAMMRSGAHTDLANAALAYLVGQKDSFGTWYSTQATIMSLKALLQSVRSGEQIVNSDVSVLLNSKEIGSFQITPQNYNVVQVISTADFEPGNENQVEFRSAGSGNLMYQVTAGYYLPWDQADMQPQPGSSKELMQIGVNYDRTELAVDETVQVNVRVALNSPGTAQSVLVDLGLPPGFSVQNEDLDALVSEYNQQAKDSGQPGIERYELTGRQILVYVVNLSNEHPLVFSYRLRAKFPLRAQTPASSAYDYYNPSASSQAAPVLLVVDQ